MLNICPNPALVACFWLLTKNVLSALLRLFYMEAIHVYVFCRGVDISSHLLNLPYCLRAEFYHSLVGERLEKVPMFQGCSPAFLRLLCSKALYQHFSAGEYIVKSGDVEHCLYLIKRGKVIYPDLNCMKCFK